MGVNVAEVVASGLLVLQVHREQWLDERACHVVKPSQLWGRGNCIETAECKTEKTVRVGVLGKLSAHILGSFDSLVGKACFP